MDEIYNSGEYWIGDTGATIHVTNSAGIYNCANSSEAIKVVMGNGSKINKEAAGTLKGWIIDEGSKITTWI